MFNEDSMFYYIKRKGKKKQWEMETKNEPCAVSAAILSLFSQLKGELVHSPVLIIKMCVC